MLFLMDYTVRRRVKIWGTARVVEDDPELDREAVPRGLTRARAEQAIVFAVDRHRHQLPAAHPANAFCRRRRRGDR